MTFQWLDGARARWLPRSEESMLVRAWLSAPVALPRIGAVTLEGLLQSAVIVAETGALPGDAFAAHDGGFVDLPVPIADVQMHGLAVACASWPTWSPDAREALVMHTHKPEAEQLCARKVYVTGGEAKPKRVPVPTMSAAYVEWCVRGDRARIIELLDGCRALSKWRGAMGSVDRWEVMRVSLDLSLVRDGSPARPLPVADEAEAIERFPRGYVLDECQTRAPYWHRATRALCACPPC